MIGKWRIVTKANGFVPPAEAAARNATLVDPSVALRIQIDRQRWYRRCMLLRERVKQWKDLSEKYRIERDQFFHERNEARAATERVRDVLKRAPSMTPRSGLDPTSADILRAWIEVALDANPEAEL